MKCKVFRATDVRKVTEVIQLGGTETTTAQNAGYTITQRMVGFYPSVFAFELAMELRLFDVERWGQSTGVICVYMQRKYVGSMCRAYCF